MVAAARLRRVQDRVAAGRPYANKIAEIVHRVASHAGEIEHPLLEVRRPPERVALVVVTSERGLCGSYNANVLRAAARHAESFEAPVEYIVVGRKGREYLARRGFSIIAAFEGVTLHTTPQEMSAIAQSVRGVYEEKRVDEVHLVYTEFVSTVVHRPKIVPFLPFVAPAAEEGELAAEVDYLFEPEARELLAALIPRYVDTEIYHMLLESLASEQAARMLAMSNASNNAEEMLQQLTLTFHKARQAGITRELLEVVAGAEALKQS